MNEFICQGCGAHSFSAASLENLRHKTCEQCGAPVTQKGPEPPKNPKIIAVDFDGCLVTNRFPEVGEPIPATIAARNRRAQPENSRQHALQTGVCPMCEDCPGGCPVEAPNDSRNRPENEPLTLDELRQMDGETVFVGESMFWVSGSGTVSVEDGGVFDPDYQDGYWPFDDYGEWLAYRRKPERSEG